MCPVCLRWKGENCQYYATRVSDWPLAKIVNITQIAQGREDYDGCCNVRPMTRQPSQPGVGVVSMSGE